MVALPYGIVHGTAVLKVVLRVRKSLGGAVTGLLGGFFGGLAGLGGGVVMIPLMTGLMKLTQHQAHGTSLVAIIFTALASAASYSMHGSVDWKVSAILAATAMITARFGARFAHALPANKLRRAFGIFLIFVSLLLVAKGFLLRSGSVPGPVAGVFIFGATGVVAGFVSGMMGVGGGAIMVPLMVIVGGMSQHVAQGTSLLAMVPIAGAGAFTHHRLGNVKTEIALSLGVGAIVGGYLGGSMANLIPELWLRTLFSLVGIWMGLRYIRSS